MRILNDETIRHLREVADLPDLDGTPYRLIELIARGGMGTIYLVHDERLGRRVAMKVLGIPDPDGLFGARMLREAAIVARLEHPNIIPIHDVGTLADGRPFYVMKLVRGDRLSPLSGAATAYAATGTDGAGRSLRELLRIFLSVCDGVAFAHGRGVIHRDLKPENIMTGAFGEVLVMDWGAATLRPDIGGKRADGADDIPTGARALKPAGAEAEPAGAIDESRTIDEGGGTDSGGNDGGATDGILLGTPAYMSPEQARGEAVDQRSDIYALGAILYTMLTGRAPYEASGISEVRRLMAAAPPPPPRRLARRIPRPLEAICLKAMAAEPGARYAEAGELARDVARLLDGEAVSAYRENVLERLARWAKRNRFLLLLVAAYLLMRVLLFFFARP